MTIINFKVDDEKKKKIEEITQIKGYDSVSEFIREAIDEKMGLQKVVDDFLEKNPPLDREKIEIPDFIPDGKYLGISRNTIVSIEDTFQEALRKLLEKFPEASTGVIRKGKEFESFETLFSLFSPEKLKCYQQAEINNRYYPFLELYILNNKKKNPIYGLIDTGASISALDQGLVEKLDIKPHRKTEIMTANGLTESSVYKTTFGYENQSYDLEFTSTSISGLPIQAFLGKNFIDKFNVLFLGKEKLFCLQTLIE